jgi:anthranilate phosphoribosyltransferase
MFNEYLNKIAEKENLTRKEAGAALQLIIDEKISAAEIGAFLFGLRVKGESTSELLGFLDTMENSMIKIELNDKNAIDVCGTGGDSKQSFNVSTAVSFIAAAGGVTVAKHGNRSVSSKSGSADVLETLGVKIGLTPQQSQKCINETGIGFLFAPLYHPAMKAVVPHRKNLAVRTFFNMLGPLLNPAGVKRQLIGVYNNVTAKKMANVVREKGYFKAITVHSSDGFDEISPFEQSNIYELEDQNLNIKKYKYQPPSFSGSTTISGGSSEENAAIILDIFKGKRSGADRQITILNAGFSLYIGGKSDTIENGISLAEQLIDNGKALDKLNEYITFSNTVN